MLRRSRKRNRRLIAALADTHAGHTLGLLNPDTVLVRQIDEHGQAEEWCPQLTSTQRFLFPLYLEHVNTLKEMAAGDEIIVFHAGDPTQGTKYKDGLIPGVDRTDQRRIAVANLMPLLSLPNVQTVRLFTSTPAHVWPGYMDARIAHTLQGLFPAKSVKSLHHSRTRGGEEIFDTSHHGPHPGSRDWLRGNVAFYYLRDRVYRDRRMGKEPARVYIRGHRHTWIQMTLHDRWRLRHSQHDLTVVPSYCGLSLFGQQVTQSEPELVNGMCIYELVDGKLAEIHPLIEYTDLRLEETL